jgi:hypothetical protein
MSEHRGRGRRLIPRLRPKAADPARWERQFRAKTFCPRYPNCCFFDLACYQMVLKERPAELAEGLILARLGERRCPDPEKKRYAVTAARNLWQDRGDLR